MSCRSDTEHRDGDTEPEAEPGESLDADPTAVRPGAEARRDDGYIWRGDQEALQW